MPTDSLHYFFVVAMSSRIQADLQRIDAALRSCPNRASLKSDAMESWKAGYMGISAVMTIYCSSIFSDPNGGAAPWLHWRKSSASKQLLGFMRAAVEVVEADQSTTLPTPELLVARAYMYATLHGCVGLLARFFASTQSAALWPAMRDWIVDQGGMESVWAALAQSTTLAARERGTLVTTFGTDVQQSADGGAVSEAVEALSHSSLRVNIISALTMTNQLPIATSASRPEGFPLPPGLVASLSSLFSDVLPRDIAAGNAHKWDLVTLVCQVLNIWLLCRSVGTSRG